jgi:hypothetical protein
LEVQGHTDNVGGDDYNQKLSDSRAAAVLVWLRAKGIAADRLTAHGYGLKVPIADNGSDEGRAKNRWVEIKKQGCGKQESPTGPPQAESPPYQNVPLDNLGQAAAYYP